MAEVLWRAWGLGLFSQTALALLYRPPTAGGVSTTVAGCASCAIGSAPQWRKMRQANC